MSNIIDVKANEYQEPVYMTSILVEDCAQAVSNGYSMTEWCRQHKLNYGSFRAEIRKSHSFMNRIAEAEIARQEWLKEELLKVMRQILEHNPQRCFDDNGNYLGMADLPEESAKIIKKAKIKLQAKGPGEDPDEILDLEFYDKQKSIDQLGKYIQMFVERIDIHHKVTLEETVTRSYEQDILAKRRQQGEIIDVTDDKLADEILNTAIQNQSK